MDNGTRRTNEEREPHLPIRKREKVGALLKEIRELKQLKTEATDGATKEEMQVEIMKLVAEVNNELGTDHVLQGSKMTVLNQH